MGVSGTFFSGSVTQTSSSFTGDKSASWTWAGEASVNTKVKFTVTYKKSSTQTTTSTATVTYTVNNSKVSMTFYTNAGLSVPSTITEYKGK